MPNDPSNWRSAWITLFGTAPTQALQDLDLLEIRTAFRRRARQTHPDVASPDVVRADVMQLGGQDAGKAFREITEAYEQLRRSVEHARRAGPQTPLRPPRNAPQTPARQSLRHPPVAAGPIRVTAGMVPPGLITAPPRRLALAQFLFHIGWVSWKAVLESLQWQRKKRPPLGKVAIDLGALDEGEVRKIVANQRTGELFGACGARLGLLSPSGVMELLARQRRRQPLVGQFFVRRGWISPEQLREALQRQREHNQGVALRGAGRAA